MQVCSGNDCGTSSVEAHHDLYFKAETYHYCSLRDTWGRKGQPGIGSPFSGRERAHSLGSTWSSSAPLALLRLRSLGGKAQEQGSRSRSTQHRPCEDACGLAWPRPGPSAPAWVTLSGQKNRTTHCLIHSVLTITSHSCLPGQGVL